MKHILKQYLKYVMFLITLIHDIGELSKKKILYWHIKLYMTILLYMNKFENIFKFKLKCR